METTKRVNLPVVTRQAVIQPETLNEESRTVQVVFSTGAAVKREFFFSDPIFEELSLKKDHVQLSRLNSGAPFLNNHNARDLNDVIGVVEKASTDGKVGTATVRFSKRAAVDAIFQDVKDGVLRNISVGYRVHKFEETGEREGIKVMRAINWEPIEISAVPAGADDGAKFRSTESAKDTNLCEVVGSRKDDPSDENDGIDPEPPVAAKVAENKGVENTESLRNDKTMGDQNMSNEEKELLARESAKAEKERQKEIRFSVRAAKLSDEFGDKLIDEDISIDQARSQIIAKLAETDKVIPTQGQNPTVTIERDEKDTLREGMTEALLNRHRAKTETFTHMGQRVEMPGYELTEKGKPYAHRTLMELVRFSLEKEGVSTTGMSKMRLAERAFHSTSDFPEVLANVANKTLRDAYGRAPATWMPFTRQVTAPDFKEISRTNMGDGEKLEKVLENGEFQHTTLSEAAEKYSISTFGKIVAFSRQMLVNDDLAAFSRMSERMGRRARDLESDEIWGLIAANALLADGIALFAAGHGNLGTGAAPSEGGLTEGRLAMRTQVGLDGEILNIVPTWIYVGPSDETVAEKLVANVSPNAASDINAFSSTGRTPLGLIVEPRLEVLAGSRPWYMCADLGQVDMVELARLQGEEGPATESRLGFDVDGLEMKIRHDIGTKAIDFRGLFKNPGA